MSVKLRAPAILAESPMKHSGELSADFEIRNEDMERFLDTLTTRGLVSYLCVSLSGPGQH